MSLNLFLEVISVTRLIHTNIALENDSQKYREYYFYDQEARLLAVCIYYYNVNSSVIQALVFWLLA